MLAINTTRFSVNVLLAWVIQSYHQTTTHQNLSVQLRDAFNTFADVKTQSGSRPCSAMWLVIHLICANILAESLIKTLSLVCLNRWAYSAIVLRPDNWYQKENDGWWSQISQLELPSPSSVLYEVEKYILPLWGWLYSIGDVWSIELSNYHRGGTPRWTCQPL